MKTDLTGLVRSVRAIDPEDYGPETIGRLLRELRIEDRLLSTFPVREGGYTRSLIYACDAFEVMVLRWSAGAMTPIHDHAEQRCWFTAISGTFDVANYRRRVGGSHPGFARIEATGSHTGIGAGEPDFRFGDEDIHRVCVSPAQAEAISVHVYARPVSTCLVFDDERDSCSIKHMSYDTVLTEQIWLVSA